MSYHQLTNLWGQQIFGFPNDCITNHIEKYGAFEKKNLIFLLELLDKISNPIVFDVGANIGNHTLAFSLHAQQVYSFEPVKATYSLLETNVNSNPISNVSLNNYGLSNSEKEDLIYVIQDGNIGSSGLIPSDNSIPENIQLTTAKSFIENNHIEKIDFIKIDVEGHEINALLGFDSFLSKFRPIVFSEWNPPRWKQTGYDIASFEDLFNDYSFFIVSDLLSDSRYTRHGRRYLKLKRSLLKRFNKFPTQEELDDKVLLIPLTEENQDSDFFDILAVPNEKKNLITSYLDPF